jgi:hypothetical protein
MPLCAALHVRDFSGGGKPEKKGDRDLGALAQKYGTVGVGTHFVLGAAFYGSIYAGLVCGVDLPAVSGTDLCSRLQALRCSAALQILESYSIPIDMSDKPSNALLAFVIYKVRVGHNMGGGGGGGTRRVLP